jgi:hypothetical protein
MITKFTISGGQNEYATIVEPDKHEDERKWLLSEGYMPWSRYEIKAEGHKDFGKVEELWMR